MPSDLSAPTPGQSPSIFQSPSLWERWGLRILLLLFVAVSFNNIHNQAFIGQDYALHHDSTHWILNHPDHWFYLDATNRPLIYWLGCAGYWLTRGRDEFAMAAYLCVLLNTLALWLLHATLGHALRSPVLRLSTVALIAFLPATLIASVVFAADAVAQFPLALAIWGILGAVHARTKWTLVGYTFVASSALALGNLAKFTYVAMPVAAACLLLWLWRWGRVPWRRMAFTVVFIGGIPLLAGLWLHQKAKRALANEPDRHSFNWKGTGEMTARSLLFVKRSDLRVLDAPNYWGTTQKNGREVYLMTQPNEFSYPALLHLGVFTDVMDFADRGSTDPNPKRPEPYQSFSRSAVRWGLLFSLPALIAVVAFGLRLVISIVHPAWAPPTSVAAWGFFALAWFIPLTATLPFVEHSYEWGYWLPRLVVPALWGFAVVSFAAIDRWAQRRTFLEWGVATLVVLQTYFHIRSVWY